MPEGDGATLLAFTADWHTNSIVGLNPPSFCRELESRHVPGAIGRMLWRRWREFWKIVAQKAHDFDATVYSFAVGDLGDKNKHSAVQLISKGDIDIVDAMIEVAQPMIETSNHVFILRGTEAHTGGNGMLEELLARDLDNAVRQSDKVASWWVVNAEIGGVRILVTHHPPTTAYRPWTMDAAAARAASIVAGKFLDDGDVRNMPDVAVWAHAHTRGSQAKGMGGVWGIFLPPWQLATSFSHRLGGVIGRPRVGGLWMVVQDGQILEWDWVRWAPRRDAVWKAA